MVPVSPAKTNWRWQARWADGDSLVRCRTIDVEVPAEAEIVVECLVYPDRREPEGPFGESSGYYFTFESPVGEVRAITHRQAPLYHAFAPFSRGSARS